jgi:predicted RNA-binding protein with PUA-like domain
MSYWLLKTEPNAYSYQDLERDRRTRWDGVRNATALLHIRQMRLGDGCIIYHTGDVRAAIGLATVASDPYVDPDGDSEKWVVVDVEVGRPLPRPVPLADVKSDPAFQDSPLLRISRLSVVPLTDAQYRAIAG